MKHSKDYALILFALLFHVKLFLVDSFFRIFLESTYHS